jgi:hypothetical protein
MPRTQIEQPSSEMPLFRESAHANFHNPPRLSSKLASTVIGFSPQKTTGLLWWDIGDALFLFLIDIRCGFVFADNSLKL